ncbi:NUDIX hydrolase [Patescibacteria group bacterium]|nr:NUDIX hydrolase [Patescibacteria group bacterium]
MKEAQNIFTHNRKAYRATWITTDSLVEFSPITQVYGVCFDSHGHILICLRPGSTWNLPGGSPEPNETLEQTLAREFMEEVNAEIKNLKPLGVQKVELVDSETKGDKPLYQARFFCKLVRSLPQKTDPACGEIRERKFVSSDEINQYIQWGDVGKEIFSQAYRYFLQERDKN